jgi:hypothetical protein
MILFNGTLHTLKEAVIPQMTEPKTLVLYTFKPPAETITACA